MKLGIQQSIGNYLFSDNNLAPYRAPTGLYGYIDNTGNIVIQPYFLCAGPFVDNFAPVGLSISDDQKFIEIGYIDYTGKVFIRQGDIYPHSEEDLILPTFNNQYAVTHSSIESRSLPIGVTGFPDPDLSTLPYLTAINNKGLSICYYKPVSGLPDRNVIVKSNTPGFIPIRINGNDEQPEIPSPRDEMRQLLYTHALPKSKLHFTNSNADGIYIFESIEKGNFLFEFNEKNNEFTLLSEVDDFKISQFYQGKALFFNANNELRLVDKYLNSKSTPIDFHGLRENIEIGYNPQSNLVCVFASLDSQEDSYLNIFDLASKQWKLEKPIRRYFDVFPYSEVVDNLLYFYDLNGPLGGPYVQQLHIRNLDNDYTIAVKGATDTKNGMICIETLDDELKYINHNGDTIFSFKP